jgi:zinc protease
VTVTVPDLEPASELRVPPWAERTLPTGLTVIAVRRPTVPMVEMRLRVPMANAPLAAVTVLADTVLSGTASMSNVEIAAELQSAGASLGTGVDPDRLLISGNGLVTGWDRTMEILTDALTGATYPEQEVATERDRIVQQIEVAKRQPAHLAREVLLRRWYGNHPYGVETPEVAEVQAVDRETLRDLHAQRLHPAGATLVLVGDLDPDEMVESAAAALAAWDGGGGVPAPVPPVPPTRPGLLLLADRPGSVQSSIRLALPAVGRTHPDHPALQLANLVLGGYFSSRLMENLREDKGYTYGLYSAIEHSAAGSVLVASADVATEVTAPALWEIWYELGRLACLPPSVEEVAQARQFALGGVQLGMSTQSGLAGTASAFAGVGLRLDFLARYAAELAAVEVADVAAAAATYLAPAGAVTVALGDAATVEGPLSRLGPLARTEP